jgi:hypothetical protein
MNLTWRKSSFTDNGMCVEMADCGDGAILVRNSNHPDAGTLTLTRAELGDWLDRCKAGEFDDLM